MRNCFLSVVLFISMSVSSQELPLNQGVGVTVENLAALAQTSLPLSVARSGQRTVGDPVVRAFYYSEDSDIVYSLSEGTKLYATRHSNRDLIGSWKLDRWPDQHIVPEIKKRHEENYWTYPQEKYSTGHTVALGCYQNNPLRYGDLSGDQQNELVLFLGSDFVVFSPQLKKIIFGETLRVSDWLTVEQTVDDIKEKQTNKPLPFQYLSGILSDTTKIEAGYRGYSKLYFGDFDENGEADILVWRKLYESRTADDDVLGFIKIRDEWQHFSKKAGSEFSGEYIPQATAAEQIKTWLAAKQLTWSKGYPSKSECPGQTDQLIPEMHDPLLNDPEVLQ